MNIETQTSIQSSQTVQKQTSTTKKSDSTTPSFADELKNTEETKSKNNESEESKTIENSKNTSKNDDKNSDENLINNEKEQSDEEPVEDAFEGLTDAVEEINKLNHKDEIDLENIKPIEKFDDRNRKREEQGLIDNNMNIQEPKEKINLEMGSNMNFDGNGQPFAEFVNQDNTKVLKVTSKEAEEEKAILSTMEENIAIANKNIALNKTKTVHNESGIKKVDKNSNITVDTVVSYDTVIMNKSDVEFFANLVNNGIEGLDNSQTNIRSAHVSKTLADLLAKSMNENKPIRIDFDNNISVIIKINREGKISADFLPSSQIAEAYLKENLPLLKQRFDEQNIAYEELNQRKQQQKQDTEDNRKKGRKDE